jgi:hypothetical protein
MDGPKHLSDKDHPISFIAMDIPDDPRNTSRDESEGESHDHYFVDNDMNRHKMMPGIHATLSSESSKSMIQSQPPPQQANEVTADEYNMMTEETYLIRATSFNSLVGEDIVTGNHNHKHQLLSNGSQPISNSNITTTTTTTAAATNQQNKYTDEDLSVSCDDDDEDAVAEKYSQYENVVVVHENKNTTTTTTTNNNNNDNNHSCLMLSSTTTTTTTTRTIRK